MTASSAELQRTREWWLARRGKITSSRIHRVVNGTERGWKTLVRELAEELRMDEMPAWRGTAAMRRGEQLEPATLANAALDFGFTAVPVGFVRHPTIPYIGASSDFLVRLPRKRKLLNGEGKAPNLARHMAIVMNRQLPPEYFCQVQLQMEVHRCDLTYFISHNPLAPDWRQRTVKLEIPREQAYVDHMLARCAQFWRLFTFTDEPISNEIPETF